MQRLDSQPVITVKIALADPNNHQLQDLIQLLSLEHVEVVEISTPHELVISLENHGYSLLLLDLSFAKGLGLQQLKSMRKNHSLPIIFTGEDLIDSIRITAFEMGADEVVQKPYQVKEMVLRILAMVRRTAEGMKKVLDSKPPSISQIYWRKKFLQIDLLGHRVLVDGQDIELTSSEWEIFILLLNHPGHVFSRNQLSEQCLGYSPEGETRTIDTHIANLRSKLHLEDLIETVRGYGYRMILVEDDSKIS